VSWRSFQSTHRYRYTRQELHPSIHSSTSSPTLQWRRVLFRLPSNSSGAIKDLRLRSVYPPMHQNAATCKWKAGRCAIAGARTQKRRWRIAVHINPLHRVQLHLEAISHHQLHARPQATAINQAGTSRSPFSVCRLPLRTPSPRYLTLNAQGLRNRFSYLRPVASSQRL